MNCSPALKVSLVLLSCSRHSSRFCCSHSSLGSSVVNILRRSYVRARVCMWWSELSFIRSSFTCSLLLFFFSRLFFARLLLLLDDLAPLHLMFWNCPHVSRFQHGSCIRFGLSFDAYNVSMDTKFAHVPFEVHICRNVKCNQMRCESLISDDDFALITYM